MLNSQLRSDEIADENCLKDRQRALVQAPNDAAKARSTAPAKKMLAF